MKDLRLILRFKAADGKGVEVRSAARISINGSGALVLHPPHDGPDEKITLPARLLSIHSIA